MMSSRMGTKRELCEICLSAGVEKGFFNAQKTADHKREHAAKLISLSCKACFAHILLDSLFAVSVHEKACQGAGTARSAKRHHQDTACPRCGEDLSNRSESHKLDHLSGRICSPREDEDEPGVEAFVDNEVPAPEFNGMARGNLPEQWNKRVIDVDKSLLAEAEDEEKLCDSILVNGLRGMGHELSDRAFSDLFKLLNLQEFRSGFQKGQLSKSFVSVLNDSKNNTCWMERTIRKSVVYVRDLLEVSLLNFGRRNLKFYKVLLEMRADQALWNSFDFDGSGSIDVDEHGTSWGHRWTSFPIYQTRKRALVQKFGSTVDLVSWGLWLDSGETDSNSSIYILVAFPMNAPASMLPRPDCLFPIGYVYHASDIVDCFEVLLPQFESLRDVPRSFNGCKRSIVVEINLLTGDNPAVTKLLRLMESAKAMIPCKDCMIKSSVSQRLFLNDPTRWKARIRTQELSEAAVSLMRRDATVTQKDTGM